MKDLTKVSMVMMSHLSDAQELIGFVCGSEASDRINFVKFLILRHKDLNEEIDADAEYAEYCHWQIERKKMMERKPIRVACSNGLKV